MAAQGWTVNSTEYDPERQVYSWRHEGRRGPCPTLRITRQVLEGFPAFALLYHLDRLKVSAAIRARPDARYVVVQNSTRVTLEEALG